ncbi:DUF397 domain-containing protein [Streptomyces sp. NPDC007100]|uniref:DUF397 domain-containing protein n=1 Tax=unclassified Streptomyces TaxID=2593676 RepID=UPI0034061233
MSAECQWVKSSYSDDEGAACVELAFRPQVIHVRDSKCADGPRLTFPANAWAAFISLAASGG